MCVQTHSVAANIWLTSWLLYFLMVHIVALAAILSFSISFELWFIMVSNVTLLILCGDSLDLYSNSQSIFHLKARQGKAFRFQRHITFPSLSAPCLFIGENIEARLPKPIAPSLLVDFCDLQEYIGSILVVPTIRLKKCNAKL